MGVQGHVDSCYRVLTSRYYGHRQKRGPGVGGVQYDVAASLVPTGEKGVVRDVQGPGGLRRVTGETREVPFSGRRVTVGVERTLIPVCPGPYHSPETPLDRPGWRGSTEEGRAGPERESQDETRLGRPIPYVLT